MARDPIYVLDASVIIDYVGVGDEILELIAHFLGRVILPRPVLLEVSNLSLERCRVLGVDLYIPEPELLNRAMNMGRSLSFQDELCLAVAQEMEATLVTSDGALGRRAKESEVAVVRGLALLLQLVDAGGLSQAKALQVAEAIHGNNPFYITRSLLSEFQSRLKSRERGR